MLMQKYKLNRKKSFTLRFISLRIEVINNLFLIPMFKEEGGFSPENMSSCIKIAAACRIIDLRRPLSGDTTKEQEEIICQLSGEL